MAVAKKFPAVRAPKSAPPNLKFCIRACLNNKLVWLSVLKPLISHNFQCGKKLNLERQISKIIFELVFVMCNCYHYLCPSVLRGFPFIIVPFNILKYKSCMQIIGLQKNIKIETTPTIVAINTIIYSTLLGRIIRVNNKRSQ